MCEFQEHGMKFLLMQNTVGTLYLAYDIAQMCRISPPADSSSSSELSCLAFLALKAHCAQMTHCAGKEMAGGGGVAPVDTKGKNTGLFNFPRKKVAKISLPS